MGDLSAVLLDSIRAGLANRREAMRYAMRFGRGIDAATNERFVDMYVNELTEDYGEEGREVTCEVTTPDGDTTVEVDVTSVDGLMINFDFKSA